MKMTFLYLPLFALLFVGCGDSAEVGTTCEKFLQARMLLREDQTNLLEEVASKDMFELMMLHREYEKIVGAPISRPDLRLRTKSVTMDDAGCGICKMSGELHYQIHVCKEDEKWVVVAENDHFPSEEDKSKARKKIEDQMEFLAGSYRQNRAKPGRLSSTESMNRFFELVKRRPQSGFCFPVGLVFINGYQQS